MFQSEKAAQLDELTKARDEKRQLAATYEGSAVTLRNQANELDQEIQQLEAVEAEPDAKPLPDPEVIGVSYATLNAADPLDAGKKAAKATKAK